MIIVLLIVYLAILFGLVKLGIVRFNLFWKISPGIVYLALLIGLFIPMGWGAPQGIALVVRQSVQIVPNVAGEVIEVPVQPNMPLKAEDVLFRIDPVPYKASVDTLEAQLKFQELRLSQMTQLQERQAARTFDVERHQAEVDQLKAQIEGARYNLEQTVVRAPTDGYVTNLGLRKGARVSNVPRLPVMAFIDTSETIVGVEIQQNDARYLRAGQPVEVTFKFFPGQIFTGKVQSVLQAVSSGQIAVSGQAIARSSADSAPFVVRLTLDDEQVARQLPAGAAGYAAIFTDRVRPTHVIRKVLLRVAAILNYVWPYT